MRHDVETVSVCVIVIGALTLFVLSLAIHVAVWRIRRPESYRTWVPVLLVIFGPLAAALARLTVRDPLQLAAVLLLHGSFAAVYLIGYTLLSAFSPSVELMKLLDREPAGVPAAAVRLPGLAGALSGDRIDNLAAAGLICHDGGRVRLGDRGMRLTRLVLWYRHAIGLPDGEGG